MAEYFERDVLKERFKKRLDWLKKDIHDEYSGALYDSCETDMELIDEIPVADVVLVRHGRWDDSFDGITPYCSVCGQSHRLMTRTPNYCPNCGAKMDGGADNAD